MTTDTYTTPTNYTSWVVPAGVFSLTVDAVAGAGGGVTPGAGGRVQATVTVTPGDTLRLYVGEEGGYEAVAAASHSADPGGGTGYASGGSGGGWTGITLDDGATALVIAGAGGGSSGTPSFVAGGDGGGLTAQAGADDSTCTGGGGGTPSAGGAAGTGGGGTNYVTPGDGAAWTSGLSSQARAGYRVNFNRSAGSGGGGWYSGGGGASDVSSSSGDRAAGGGGSSYTNPTYASGVTHTQGYNASGAGSLTITYCSRTGWCAPLVGLGDVKTASGTSLTFTSSDLPSGVRKNDRVIAVCGFHRGDDSWPTTSGSGWTGHTATVSGSGGCDWLLYSAHTDASDVDTISSVTISRSGGSSPPGTYGAAGRLFVFRGSIANPASSVPLSWFGNDDNNEPQSANLSEQMAAWVKVADGASSMSLTALPDAFCEHGIDSLSPVNMAWATGYLDGTGPQTLPHFGAGTQDWFIHLVSVPCVPDSAVQISHRFIDP